MTCYPKIDALILRESSGPPDYDAGPPVTPGIDDNEIALYYKADGQWYVRLKNGTEQVFTTGGGTTAWNDITGKPISYPPETHAHSWVDIPDIAWAPFTFLNGWRNYNASTRDSARWRRRNNVIYLRGFVTGGSPGSNICRLPSGARPQIDLLIPTISGHGKAETLYVETNGYIHTSTLASSWVSLHVTVYLD